MFQQEALTLKTCFSTAATIGVLLTASISAQAKELDPELKQYVIASCSVDAYRLCPQSLGNQDDAVSCMKSKRSQLNQTCRVAYEKVVRVLKQ